MDAKLPDAQVLLDFSDRSLQDLELAALNHAANLTREMRAALQAWTEQKATAIVARWILENRGYFRKEEKTIGLFDRLP